MAKRIITPKNETPQPAKPKRVAKPKKEISIEQTLWSAADKLRGTFESLEY